MLGKFTKKNSMYSSNFICHDHPGNVIGYAIYVYIIIYI